MKKATLLLAALASLATCIPATAQDAMETVNVTGIRASIDPSEIPHIYLLHRADHLITKVTVTCDTRDPAKRRAELKETLRGMIRSAAGTGSISLGVGDEIVADLTEKMLDKVIEPDARQDTSRAEVIVKTRVTANDMFDDATARIERFIDATPKAGRTEILRNKHWDLTIVGPEQYRAAVIAKVAEDAKKTAALIGTDYAVKIEGLQRKIAWYQKGPLDLALYIPYAMTVQPK